jgi:FSR family fosmidomycin resistance protein-like MFS transporter
MLLAGVAGQFVGGSLSDKFGRKEVTMVSLLSAAPLLYLFLNTSGALSMAFLFLVGFSVMSSFSVTLVMIQEIMSRHVGIASGLMIGFALGVGGIGVLITGLLADAFGIRFALHFLVILPLIGGTLTCFVPYANRAGERGRASSR